MSTGVRVISTVQLGSTAVSIVAGAWPSRSCATFFAGWHPRATRSVVAVSIVTYAFELQPPVFSRRDGCGFVKRAREDSNL